MILFQVFDAALAASAPMMQVVNEIDKTPKVVARGTARNRFAVAAADGQVYLILIFLETGDRTTPVSDQRDCVPPPLALPACAGCVPR